MKYLIGILPIVIAACVVAMLTTMNTAEEEKDEQSQVIQVAVTYIAPTDTTDKVIGYGQVAPRWETSVSSEVTGTVRAVSDKFLSGTAFEQGDTLASIESTEYVAELENAKATLATAQRTLQEEEKRSAIAKENWVSSGFEGEPSDMVLRKPYVEEAKQAINAAKALVQKAQYNLEQTVIKAPYDGVVMTRQINPGDFVQKGMLIGTIYNRSVYEISVPLTAQKIGRLASMPVNQAVKIVSSRSNKETVGVISRVEQIIDKQNRWQNVVISVSDTEPLLPGDFVKVIFPGKTYSNILPVPEHFQSGDGALWYVDDEQVLQRFQPTVLFKDNGLLYVQFPFKESKPLYFTASNDSLLPNTEVERVLADGAEGQ